jgi:hypothetical protein
MTEQEIQNWFDSGPIKRETLELWLKLINDNNKD